MSVSAKRARRKGFALHSKKGLEFALVQDGTGKDVKEILEMGDKNRQLTALVRARFYKEKGKEADKAQRNGP